jgi:hypothetical protein
VEPDVTIEYKAAFYYGEKKKTFLYCDTHFAINSFNGSAVSRDMAVCPLSLE